MTPFQKIIEAIKAFGYPYAPDIYKGKEDRYFTYNYVDERVAIYSDNEPDEETVSVQIHFFLPASENFIAEKSRIRRALFKHGFTYPEVTVLTENDTKIRHIIFECETETERLEDE